MIRITVQNIGITAPGLWLTEIDTNWHTCTDVAFIGTNFIAFYPTDCNGSTKAGEQVHSLWTDFRRNSKKTIVMRMMVHDSRFNTSGTIWMSDHRRYYMGNFNLDIMITTMEFKIGRTRLHNIRLDLWMGL